MRQRYDSMAACLGAGIKLKGHLLGLPIIKTDFPIER